MTWTPDTPSLPAWISEPVADATWSRYPTFFPDWRVESIGSTQRVTEDGRLRVTEQGAVIRIIERFETTWDFSPPPHNTWT